MKYDLFILRSLKVLSGGVTIKYQKSGDSAIITYEDSGRASHPDMIDSMKKLESHFDKIFLVDSVVTIVKGINFKGENLQFTGMMEAQNGSLCSLNSPFFSISENGFGLDEKDLLDDLESIKSESYSYIFSLKSAQKAIEFDEKEN